MASGAPVPPAGTSIFPQAWFPYVDIPTSMIPLMPAAYNARKMLCPGCDRDMKLVQTSRNRECCQKSLSSIASAANSRKQLRRSAQPNVLPVPAGAYGERAFVRLRPSPNGLVSVRGLYSLSVSPITDLIFPPAFEPIRRQLRVAHRVLNVPMPQVGL